MAARGLPRTRGDGPEASGRMRQVGEASPHTRGWTRQFLLGVRQGQGFPAHAGMDPTAGCRPPPTPRLPRTRGDGPYEGAIRGGTYAASPHTRGWTHAERATGPARRGFPAHAGMDPGRYIREGVREWLPRTRGDGPPGSRPAAPPPRASPHTRGWTPGTEGRRARSPGFPAHAGMDPARPGRRRGGRWLPRTRGDGPRRRRRSRPSPPASPHTRGWTALGRKIRSDAQGFPAHAGMDPRRPAAAAASRRLPRTRGDGPRAKVKAMRTEGASPHTRGWTRDHGDSRTGRRGFPAHAGMDRAAVRRGRFRRGFPAHAGMDPRRRPPAPAPRRLPRTRGDGPSKTAGSRGGSGASPHTRGWTQRGYHSERGARGFPAHAGMDPGGLPARNGKSRLPRTRGDGPALAAAVNPPSSASPHTRGWTLGAEAVQPRGRGFPAHAGMDPSARRQPAPAPRLPRTRGDGPRDGAHSPPADRASPHTRGWTRCAAAGSISRSGFPAHAGMDPSPRPGSTAHAGLPRTRGDGPRLVPVVGAGDVASPHTRGWTPGRHHASAAGRGFPAHAGMDPCPYAVSRGSSRLPRTRGDGPRAGIPRSAAPAASPHTRGWTRRLRAGSPGVQGFPAHAGMDPYVVGWRNPGLRLPRTRGDGPVCACVPPENGWASPHTRGWT